MVPGDPSRHWLSGMFVGGEVKSCWLRRLRCSKPIMWCRMSVVYLFSLLLCGGGCIRVSQDTQVSISFLQGVYYYMSVYPWEKMGMRPAF
jgi:hypothetical protein